jgi:hypothetical protein
MKDLMTDKPLMGKRNASSIMPDLSISAICVTSILISVVMNLMCL